MPDGTESSKGSEYSPDELVVQTSLRLPYAAVPLDPWGAKHPNNPETDYYSTSIENLRMIARSAIEKLVSGDKSQSVLGRARMPSRIAELAQFIEDSLVLAQNDRVKHNNRWVHPEEKNSDISETDQVEDGSVYLSNPVVQKAMNGLPLSEMVDMGDPRVERAMKGLSDPAELLDIAIDYPLLPSLEIAKQSHPLEFGAEDPMITAVAEALGTRGFQFPFEDQLHYKPKRIHYSLGGMIIVRKRIVAEKQAYNGKIDVVERRSLLVMDSPEIDIVSDHYVLRHHQSDEGFTILSDMTEAQLRSGDAEDCSWLFPLTTSVYTRRAV